MSFPHWHSEDPNCGPDKFIPVQHGESSKEIFRTNLEIDAIEHESEQQFFQNHPEANSQMHHGTFNFDQFRNELDHIRHDMGPRNKWVADFLKEQKISQQHNHITHHPYDNNFEDFEKIYNNNSQPKDSYNDNWINEFAQIDQMVHNQSNPEEIEAFEKAFDEAKKSAIWKSEFEAQEQSWATEFNKQLNEESAINADDSNMQLAETARKLIESVEEEANPKFKNSNFMNFMKKLRDHEVSIEGNKVVEQNLSPSNAEWAADFDSNNKNNWANEFSTTTQQNKGKNKWTEEFIAQGNNTHANNWARDFAANMEEDIDFAAKWSEEFEKSFGKKNYKDKSWDELQDDWDKYTPSSMGYKPTPSQFEEYHFQSANPTLSRSTNTSSQLKLRESISALEAEVQLDPKNANAWYQLGIKQQENEHEAQAIAALKRAISLEPKILDAWLSLSASYTNEYRYAEADNALKSWIENNDKYNHNLESQHAKIDHNDQHRFITQLFLNAAISNPGENLDPDVQIGLGILYNMSDEYSKAVDCFQSALTKRPNDYVLWNKLGATLANAKQFEKAVNAYSNALQINPFFIRAKYNLAVTLIDLGEFKEAAQNLLQALSLQTGNDNSLMVSKELGESHGVLGGEMSSNIWNHLRMCLGFLNRPDLFQKWNAKDLNGLRQGLGF
nr:12939_t:CDS:2 [Entrophospora candida]